MKKTKILLSTLSIALFTFPFAACGGAANNTAPTVNTNKSNTAPVVNPSPSPVDKATPAANTNGSPAAKPSAAKPGSQSESMSDATKISGELQTGSSESLILYVGAETGDYAAYCFANDSEAGRAIAAACKKGDRCEVSGEIEPGKCEVPGLEADLSDSGRIVKVAAVKSLGPKKK